MTDNKDLQKTFTSSFFMLQLLYFGYTVDTYQTHTYVQYIIARYILIVGRNWKKFQLTIFQGKEYREKLKVEEEREYLLVYFIKEMRIEENQQEEN